MSRVNRIKLDTIVENAESSNLEIGRGKSARKSSAARVKNFVRSRTKVASNFWLKRFSRAIVMLFVRFEFVERPMKRHFTRIQGCLDRHGDDNSRLLEVLFDWQIEFSWLKSKLYLGEFVLVIRFI